MANNPDQYLIPVYDFYKDQGRAQTFYRWPTKLNIMYYSAKNWVFG